MKYLEIIETRCEIPKIGQIFAYRIRGQYRFGRIIKRIQGQWSNDEVLTYFYKPNHKFLSDIPELKVDDLLIPPIILIEDTWKHGYFAIPNTPFIQYEVLPVHCFGTDSKGYTDEYGNELDKKYYECALSRSAGGLSSIDFLVGRSLGYFATEEEYVNSSELPNSVPKKTTSEELQIIIQRLELDARKMDLGDIEIPLAQYVTAHRMGNWLESGVTAEHYHFFFLIRRKSLSAFAEHVHSMFGSLGIRDYSVMERESGKFL